MSPYVRTATSAFETACRIPALKSARIDIVTGGKEANRMITATWNQTSIAAGKKLTFSTAFLLEKGSDALRAFPTGYPSPLAENDLQVTEGDVRVQIQKFKSEKGNIEQEVLHVFRSNRLQHSFNLTDLDIHGTVYFDEELGGVAINAEGSKLAYIAEKKVPKSTPFCKTTNDSPCSTAKDGDKAIEGSEFCFRDEFGEQMVGKSRPVIVVLDLKKAEGPKFEVITDCMPPEGQWCPGQLSFWQDSLVGIAVKIATRNLGLIYCSNRPCLIFHLCLEKRDFKVLSAEKVHARSPRVASSGRLVWLERDLDQQNIYPGPHQAAFRLMTMELAKESKPVVVVDIGDNGDKIRDVGDEKGFPFQGLFEVSLPKRCYTGDEKFVIFSNIFGDTYFPLIVELNSKLLYVQRQAPNNYVLDVLGNEVVGCHSVPLQAPTVSFSSVILKDGVEPCTAFQTLEKSTELLPGFVYKTMQFQPNEPHPDPQFQHVAFSGIYVGPEKGKEKSVPLIVWPHGGPHGVIPTSFISEAYFFCLLGYAIVFVNFRGSTGAGEKSVESILGHVGDTDVKDCHQARAECLSKYPHLNPDSVVLFGGSHGGFLVTHLAGQYPDSYKAVVARNPVINIATMATVTDIPDWTCVESGVKFEFKSPDPALMTKMFAMSPIAHVQNVQAAICLMIGKLDLRVPPSQGMEYYHSLKALGKKVEMNVYEDNHPLAKVPVNINVMINSALFFHSAVGSDEK